MEFSPSNPIVQLCIQGIAAKEKGDHAEAQRVFFEATARASNDLESFIAAFFVAEAETSASKRLQWFRISLRHAIAGKDVAMLSALPTLYSNIAECFSDLGDEQSAAKYAQLSSSSNVAPADHGPFFHGTKADLEVGDLLNPGGISNYQSGLVMNHIYFTALPNGAGLAASLAKGEGRERVYVVEPTGPFENDPNVTDKKFPGNLTRSYRSAEPLRVVGELTDWSKLTDEQMQEWRNKLRNVKGEIIN